LLFTIIAFTLKEVVAAGLVETEELHAGGGSAARDLRAE